MWEGADSARRAAAHVFVADLTHPVLDAEDRHHLARVLRLRPGEDVSVSDGQGGWRLCRFSDAPGGLEPAGDRVVVECPAPSVTVGFAPTKGERPSWAVEKLTEAGADRIVILRADRSVVRWEDRRGERHGDRLAAVARAAAMQSRRLWLPEIRGPWSVAETVERLAAGEGVRAADGTAAGDGVALAAPGGDPPDLAWPCVLVGPEGGWSEAEEAMGLPRIGLGRGILRTETAAVAAGLLLAALRDGLVGPVTP